MSLWCGRRKRLERITCSIAIRRLRLFTQPGPTDDISDTKEAAHGGALTFAAQFPVEGLPAILICLGRLVRERPLPATSPPEPRLSQSPPNRPWPQQGQLGSCRTQLH